MFPTSFDESNQNLGPPIGMTEDQCTSLSVWRNGEMVISCWKPTEAEWDEMTRTKRVWLIVWGVTMPPAYVGGITPFPKQNETPPDNDPG